MSSPTGSPSFTVTKAHMSRQDRVARVRVQETVNMTFLLITDYILTNELASKGLYCVPARIVQREGRLILYH